MTYKSRHNKKREVYIYIYIQVRDTVNNLITLKENKCKYNAVKYLNIYIGKRNLIVEKLL